MTTKEAVEKITTELKRDKGFYYTYQSNIAMAFYDEYNMAKDKGKVLEIANNAAMRFLNSWCNDRN